MSERTDLGRAADEDLLSATAARDGDAFRIFYHRHLPVVLVYPVVGYRQLYRTID